MARLQTIIGTDVVKSVLNLSKEFKDRIVDSSTEIKVILGTENGHDEITGDFTCSKTLMIRADKATKDLDGGLIEDLKNGKNMEVTIKLC